MCCASGWYWCNDRTGTGMGTVNSAVSIGVMIGQVLGWVQLTVL